MKYKKGDKVLCNGYKGVIQREYSTNMYEVRLNSGLVCVDKSSITIRDNAQEYINNVHYNAYIKSLI